MNAAVWPLRSRVKGARSNLALLHIYSPASVWPNGASELWGVRAHKYLWARQAWEACGEVLPTSSRKLEKHPQPGVMTAPNPWPRTPESSSQKPRATVCLFCLGDSHLRIYEQNAARAPWERIKRFSQDKTISLKTFSRLHMIKLWHKYDLDKH